MLSKKEKTDVQNVKIRTIIGKDAVLEGSFYAKETTRVDGLIKGNVELEEVLVLGATGKVEGNIKASTIMVGGVVEGDLAADEKTIISATGKVNGNIRTKKLIVDENAIFYGQCFMGEEKSAAASPQQAPDKPEKKQASIVQTPKQA